jgi:hypothetical protein
MHHLYKTTLNDEIFFFFFKMLKTAVRLGQNITEIVKGKLRLGAKILKVGGLEKFFKKLFSVSEGEKLLKASQCYLSTTDGAIAGLLFISTNSISFWSERSIKLPSPNGELLRLHYKVFRLIIYTLSLSLSLSLSLHDYYPFFCRY